MIPTFLQQREGLRAPVIPTFLHVPRSAGTTLREAIARHYDPAAILTWDDSTTLEGWRASYLRRSAEPALIMGHLPYGFPWPPSFMLEHELSYFTFLRYPVDRVVSDYHWARVLPAHRFREHCLTHTLREAMEARAYVNLDNIQTRMFAGAMDVPVGELTLEHVDLAIDNLRTFAFVGFTERFMEGVAALEKRYGWPALRHQLVDRNRTRKPEVDDVTRICVIAANALDISLYARARKAFPW